MKSLPSEPTIFDHPKSHISIPHFLPSQQYGVHPPPPHHHPPHGLPQPGVVTLALSFGHGSTSFQSLS
ncbi:hypothetical protein IKO18_05605 [bacterium]|nr:hypothetical protein [bacterium]